MDERICLEPEKDKAGDIVGATRQWVTMTLDKLQKRGLISISRQRIVIELYDMLHGLTERA